MIVRDKNKYSGTYFHYHRLIIRQLWLFPALLPELEP